MVQVQGKVPVTEYQEESNLLEQTERAIERAGGQQEQSPMEVVLKSNRSQISYSKNPVEPSHKKKISATQLSGGEQRKMP